MSLFSESCRQGGHLTDLRETEKWFLMIVGLKGVCEDILGGGKITLSRSPMISDLTRVKCHMEELQIDFK